VALDLARWGKGPPFLPPCAHRLGWGRATSGASAAETGGRGWVPDRVPGRRFALAYPAGTPCWERTSAG